ncbi:MAG: carboxypeptidase-like regulatory domain-containing protein [Acidobacteria bacterium]|nr:carboxypeptidase-like regulatory domain-containing protein [Acidobacteriota bacterium]
MRSRIVLAGAILVCLYSAVAQAQDAATITGQITTADDGLSLPGATVSIPSLNISTVTDEQGRYTLTVPGERKGSERRDASLVHRVAAQDDPDHAQSGCHDQRRRHGPRVLRGGDGRLPYGWCGGRKVGSSGRPDR